jgi:hypothetical protein
VTWSASGHEWVSEIRTGWGNRVFHVDVCVKCRQLREEANILCPELGPAGRSALPIPAESGGPDTSTLPRTAESPPPNGDDLPRVTDG